ncbi:MAG: hypothetical protein VYA06_00440 [Chloroflexota bacterium]|nr:hypothetical protein [Chloroflexota bacterium]MQG04130.1 hypothetical protein [SAR202 cluster bacterium]|tara:strand:- start:12780 stop:13010 length:231 start_codon:yes stop_codon:yes gene_type:complete
MKQLEEKLIDLRKIKSSEQVSKVKQILEEEINEVVILTDLEVIIKMIPMQILEKNLTCKMKIIDDYWQIKLIKKGN